MSSVADVIQEYLVSIGISVDSNSLNNARNSFNQVETWVNRFANSSAAQFTAAGAAVATFVAAANAALARFMTQLAQTELENEMWARAMFISTDQATALNNSLQALGATMSDLYLSPELLERFKQLQHQAFEMRPPDDYKQEMKSIRDIVFQFQRLKLEATYALQWVGYYLFKYLEKPLERFRLDFKGFNDMLVKSMPEWTKVVAQVLTWFTRLGTAALTAGKAILHLFSELPKSLVVAGGALTGFWAILKMWPIGWLIAGLTSLLLLIDDYTTYERGGKSAFAGMWEEVDKLKKLFENDKSVDGFATSIEGLAKAVDDLLQSLNNLFKAFDSPDSKNFKAFIDGLIGGLQIFVGTFKNMIDGITFFINSIADIMNGDWNKLGKDTGFSQIFEGSKELIKALSSELFHKTAFAAPAQAYHGTVTNNQTNNYSIYGSDPAATARAVSRTQDVSFQTRNFRGVFT